MKQPWWRRALARVANSRWGRQVSRSSSWAKRKAPCSSQLAAVVLALSFLITLALYLAVETEDAAGGAPTTSAEEAGGDPPTDPASIPRLNTKGTPQGPPSRHDTMIDDSSREGDGARFIRQGERIPSAFREKLMNKVASIIRRPAGDKPGSAAVLPGLRTHWRRYTPQERLVKHRAMDFIYAFVNGTEANYVFRRWMLAACHRRIMEAEEHIYKSGKSPAQGLAADYFFNALCPQAEALRKARSGAELIRKLEGEANSGVSERDRETDELRHSFRSVEQHMRWHRGRVVMVSPGHHPQWVDPAKNFLAGQCGGAEGAAVREGGGHLRVTTVHQDALLPYGMRLTGDSHVIEQNLWRVANITPVHIYLNDDYFIHRDVAITDIINEYGGTIVLVERDRVEQGKHGSDSESWAESVAHTHLFNIVHLDDELEDHLPPALLGMWRRRALAPENLSAPTSTPSPDTVNAAKTQANFLHHLSADATNPAWYRGAFDALRGQSTLYTLLETAHRDPPEPLPTAVRKGNRPRYHAAHAPFIYCTNMFRYFSMRFEREFAWLALNHRRRNATDLLIPFVYNAFIMARPWEASYQFLPYLIRLEAQRQGLPAGAAPSPVSADVQLNNEDGCAPATLLRDSHSSVFFINCVDDLAANARLLAEVDQRNPLFFNINSGFTSNEAAAQLRDFLRRQFAQPAYLELPLPAAAATPAPLRGELTALFDALMALPVVVLTSFEEGVCPAVRSLQLALPRHSGRVVAVRQRHGHGEVDATLEEVRAALQHRVRSAMPVPRCAFSARVRVSEGVRGASTAELVRGALAEEAGAGAAGGDHAGDQDGAHDGDDSEGGVLLPSACGGGGGARVRAVVVDARTGVLPVPDAVALRQAIAMPGQTLALEDFSAVRLDGGAEGDVALVLSRGDAVAKGVHWIGGASEGDLLLTYPVPYAAYEDMSAPLQWV